ncbi:condensin-2 complex subunit H2-like [Nilaparvata lugens]|uniref:condensin-2 complex subunit H2-like n=1 Tax=Nilaparvata lugens TaxID=108931 RepID=UPI00193E5F09|nr:condensin-2 complex subunit H2-like [Nilaparvata lugens]XP_039289122.1 condensin-2 complex subunit H2-like [Nilaparvata lugens]
MSHDDSGFKALLKPIQDITRSNGDVDLCRHLEEYLSHIKDLVEQRLSSMNFAEAAYLLQNSANIYSKKVDLLWTFVIQLVEALGKSKQSRGQEEGGNEGDDGAGSGDGAGQPQAKKKRAQATLSTDDLDFIECVCSKQSLDMKPKANPTDPAKKSKIVLNATTKGKPKEGVACWIFDESNEPIGKKEEFRLHWRILSSGILQEEFINERKSSRRREAVDDDDDADGPSMAFDEPPMDDEPLPAAEDAGVAEAEQVMQVDDNNCQPVDEQEFAAGQILLGGKEKEKIVDMVDVKKKAWEPSLFDQNMPEKPLRKRKILKLPEAVDDSNNKKEKRKRKMCELDQNANSYLIIDWMIEQYVKSSKIDGDLHDYEFLTVFKAECQLKRQIQLRRRRNYNELVFNSAARSASPNFRGFDEMDPDSDDEGGGFNGFVEDHFDDDVGDIDLLPDLRLEDNDIGPQEGSYENEAVKTMEAYKNRVLENEAEEMAALAERVSQWHQLIRPKLEIAERRSAFRIHDYGTLVLDAFPGDEGTIAEFGHIVAGFPREEVARTFLSTLCLTNTANVELTKTDSKDMAMDCIQLKLITRTRHHEEMHRMIENQQPE